MWAPVPDPCPERSFLESLIYMPVRRPRVDVGTTSLFEAEGRQLDAGQYDKHPFILHKIFLGQLFQMRLSEGQRNRGSIGLVIQKY
jgi:hypothetical protein